MPTPLNLPSLFTILKPGIGPSSSHTFGPLRAGGDFRLQLLQLDLPEGRLRVTLLGSLARTGKGHLTDLAVAAGLAGVTVESDERPDLRSLWQALKAEDRLSVGRRVYDFAPEADIVFDAEAAGFVHPNTLRIQLVEASGEVKLSVEYHSVGGGAVAGGGFGGGPDARQGAPATMNGLMDRCLEEDCSLAEMAVSEQCRTGALSEGEVWKRLGRLWSSMEVTIEVGLRASGLLPGRLRLERRAAEMFVNFHRNIRQWPLLPHELTLASIYAIAVAEENASGGKIVTAPTCGSAGVVPAVLKMVQERFHLRDEQVLPGLAVAGLVGALVAAHASIAGAEVGCQGEVGTASAMAAAAACQIMGGSVPQVEFAAEMALEHHLGLTCDPIFGLVQIPCIERNAVGAVTALNAANLALLSTGSHRISFDQAVATMREVGRDMHVKYKETALGGLAAVPAAK